MSQTRPSTMKLRLRLYIAGQAPNSIRATANLKAICDESFAAGFDLEIVDILLDGKRGLADRVLVTPTLVKLSPLPVTRLIGNLSDKDQVLLILGSK